MAQQRYLIGMACLAVATATRCPAGTPQKWDDLPAVVKTAVLANGGKAGMSVDLEDETKDGHAIYESGVKAADGTIHDVVIDATGKVIQVKTDDAADAAAERTDRAAKLLKGVTFSHPRQITHPYLPLVGLKQDILEGKEGGKPFRVERTARPDMHKMFTLAGQPVEAMAYEDRDYESGKLVEATMDYFAQDDAGTVYYLGEDVDEYEDGKVTGHDGSWLVGRDTPVPGVLLPAKLAVGVKWRSEDVSGDISEADEVMSMSEKITTPAGVFDCVKVKETTPDEVEYKYYAKGIGVAREQPPDGDVLLVSHAANR